MKLSDRVKVYCTDALKCQHYGNFNIFYFFNPFEKEIMRNVMDNIIASQFGKGEFLVIMHNPVCAEVSEKRGGKIVARFYDKMKSYETYLYKYNGIESVEGLGK